MTISDALKLVRRWWWVMLLCPLLVGAGAYIVSSAQTPTYRANLILVIDENQLSDVSSYNDILAAERRTRTYSHLATARPVLEETIQRLGLTFSPEALAGKVSVQPVRDTQLITVAVTDPSPARAATIANTIGQVFIEQSNQQEASVTGSGQESLQRNIDDTERKIDETSQQIADIEQRTDATSAANQATLRGLQSQLTQYQSTYSMLLEAQQRMAIAESQSASNIRIAEEAAPPSHPVSPRVMLNTALGGVLGLLIAGCLVLAVGYLDDTVKSSEDVERLTGKATLGAIPVFHATRGIESLVNPRSPAVESYRGLRTNLQFATINQEVRSLVLTSARPGDGKTSTVANLGIVLAQGGQNVIIIDADLRKPRLHKLFSKLTNRIGLTNLLLTNNADLEAHLQETDIPGLRLLTTGPLPPNPPDLLNSARMRQLVDRFEKMADIVLIDTPPMAVSDPLIVVGLADAVLLVTLGGRTRSRELARVIQELERSSTSLIGVILNRVDLLREGYYYYQSYYDSDTDTPTPGDSGPKKNVIRAGSRRGRAPQPAEAVQPGLRPAGADDPG